LSIGQIALRAVSIAGCRLGEDVRHSAEQRAIAVALERLDRLVGQRLPALLERLEAGFVVGEAKFETEGRGQRFEDAASRWDDFAADAVARNKACVVVSKGWYESAIEAGYLCEECGLPYLRR
jgi:hypothetical protein